MRVCVVREQKTHHDSPELQNAVVKVAELYQADASLPPHQVPHALNLLILLSGWWIGSHPN
jgi:hypothetical protein